MTRVDVIVITGSMGSGKTTVMAEASDLLRASAIPHAAIDIDALGIVHRSGLEAMSLAYQNLTSVCANYRAAGVTKFLLAGAIESRAELEKLRAAMGFCTLTVCRLTALRTTMEQRVRGREPGMLQQKLVERVRVLDKILDEAALEDFSISSDGRSVTDIARELLRTAGQLQHAD